MAETIRSLLEDGRLADAIARATQSVRDDPELDGMRYLLVELLCLSGDLDRADRQLRVLLGREPEHAVAAARLRRLVEGERLRRACLSEGRPPRFFGVEPERLAPQLGAARLIGEGKPGDAVPLLEAAELARPHPAGRCDGRAFDDLRDADELVAGILELITGDGQYYWVPMERIRHIAVRPVRRPRDLIWRQATVAVADGPEGDAFLPALYVVSDGVAVDDRLRLGRATHWVGGDGEPVRGLGQRLLVVGDDSRPFHSIAELAVGDASRPAAA